MKIQQRAKFDGNAPWLGIAGVSGALMIAVGITSMICQNYTLSFMLPFVWCFLVLSVFCCHTVAWIARLCLPPMRRFGRMVTFTPSVIIAVLTIILPLYNELPSVRFKRMVLSPMPRSVKELGCPLHPSLVLERESSDWTPPEGEHFMARGQKFKAEEIIGKLREAEVELTSRAVVR